MSADTRTTEELLDAARTDDEGTLADLAGRMVRRRLDHRLQGRIDPADVVQDAYLAVRRKFSQYTAAPRLPCFLWLRLEVGQELVNVHRFHLGAQMRDAGQEVSLHRGPLRQGPSLSPAEQLLGKPTTACRAAMRAERNLRVQAALNSMDANDCEELILRRFQEQSNAEAAQVLGIKPSAAVNRSVRALKRFKDVFQGTPRGLVGI
jgi:RNA polymerase sigma-70 factor (ECF subfamily)